jgi:hypothetical protein
MALRCFLTILFIRAVAATNISMSRVVAREPSWKH